MKEGIYHVRFSASTHDAGEGLVVIKQGALNGGDAGYLYTGTFEPSGEHMTCALHVKRWNSAHTSVFGPLNDFDLQLSGQFSADGFTVSGGMSANPGMTIQIVGRYLAPAA